MPQLRSWLALTRLKLLVSGSTSEARQLASCCHVVTCAFDQMRQSTNNGSTSTLHMMELGISSTPVGL